MRYHVRRGDQEYGPYTLADLQRYMATGNIVGSDLARGEGTQEWVRVDQLVAGQAAGHGPGLTTADSTGFALAEKPVPPGLHWAMVLLLSFVTCGVFTLIWLFVEAVYASRLGPRCRAPLFYGLCIVLQILAVFSDRAMTGQGGLFWLASFVFAIAGHYSIKEALEKHLSLRLNGIMVFFFHVFYFQYHLSEVRQARILQTGL